MTPEHNKITLDELKQVFTDAKLEYFIKTINSTVVGVNFLIDLDKNNET